MKFAFSPGRTKTPKLVITSTWAALKGGKFISRLPSHFRRKFTFPFPQGCVPTIILFLCEDFCPYRNTRRAVSIDTSFARTKRYLYPIHLIYDSRVWYTRLPYHCFCIFVLAHKSFYRFSGSDTRAGWIHKALFSRSLTKENIFRIPASTARCVLLSYYQKCYSSDISTSLLNVILN